MLPVFVLVLVCSSTAYLVAPDSWGGIAFFATAVVSLVSFAVGPWVHRPVNRKPWRWLTVAGALFLMGLLVRLELVTPPGLIGSADLWAFAGYGCTAPFLVGLLRRTHGGPDSTLLLDTAGVTTGAALIGWVLNVAPALNSNAELGPIVVNAIYPVMDALLLTLTMQLGFRRGTQAPALRAALVGMAALLTGDLFYSFIWLDHPGSVNPYVNVFYMVAYACLGLMACHPSMRELSDVDVQHTPSTSRARLAVILLAMLTPASIPVALPTHGLVDGVVRAVIMCVFAVFVFLRLIGTINALQRAETHARYRATHDGLTELPNRVSLVEHLDAHLLDVQAGDGPGWVNVFFVDCDQFKKVNDSWGHAAGDDVLRQVAARLLAVAGPGDFLSRVAGDEFVLRVDTARSADVAEIARQILAAFSAPLNIRSERTTMLTASIGIAQAPYSSATTAEEMIRDADLALYQAKNSGRATYAVHDAPMHKSVVRRHQIADELREALDRGELAVVYQPIRAGAGYAELTGWEALLRWQHPILGAISPTEFIPIAEDTGLIVEIGAFVLRSAANQLKSWQLRFGRPDLHVSVNVSSVQLQRDDVVALVAQVLEESGLTASSLWLEITESVVLERTESTLITLNTLAGLGVWLCMDDFGTGYSSLSYLKDFKIHILKIDRAFVQNLVRDERDRKLSKAMIDVAAALDLEGVVAEGVETEDQAAVLAQLGCSLAQGYLYGRPAAPAEAETDAALVLSAGPGHPASAALVPVARSSSES